MCNDETILGRLLKHGSLVKLHGYRGQKGSGQEEREAKSNWTHVSLSG